jgi:hypothetical protein
MTRTIIILFYLSPFITPLFSCHTKADDSYRSDTPDSVSTVMQQVVSTLNLGNGKTCSLDDCDNVLIIPIDEGCESCIQKTVSFSLTKPRQHLLVIISSASKKIFTQKMREYAGGNNDLSLAKNSILIDSSNLCFIKGLSDIMPRIFKMKKGKAKRQIMLDASDLDEELRSL